MILDRINQDLKTAMLARDTVRTDTLKSIKTAVQYADVEARAKGQSLDEPAIIMIIQKEAKKRAESAAMYQQAGADDRAQKESDEKVIIERYLPSQLSDDDINALISEAIEAAGGISQQTMGQIIGAVKQKTGGSADGAVIARLVKERLEK